MEEWRQDWDGEALKEAIKYCKNEGMFSDLLGTSSISSIEKLVGDHVGINNITKESSYDRRTVDRWMKSDSAGPCNRDTLETLNTLFDKTKWIHIPMDKELKEKLFEFYEFAWSTHRRNPLTVDGDEELLNRIKDITNLMRNKKKPGTKSMSDCPRNIDHNSMDWSVQNPSLVKHLNSFYTAFHGVLEQKGVREYLCDNSANQSICVKERRENSYCTVDEVEFWQKNEETLRERQCILEDLGDNLRTFFLGGDL